MIFTAIYFILLCLTIHIDNRLGLSIQHKLDKRQFSTTTSSAISHYTINGNYVYFAGRLVTGASASSFKSLDDGYGKDFQDVYYMDQQVRGASGSSFKSLGNGYAKDYSNYYYMGKITRYVAASSYSPTY